jgi:hypothetical protein
VVLSEPPPLDALLRAHYRSDLEGAAQRVAVSALLSALGQAPNASVRQLVVKLDAWNIFELPLLRQCFPDTPWLFVYRDPLEIAASHLRMAGMHMIPGQIGASPLDRPDEPLVPREAYIARRLGRLLEQAARMCREQGGMLVEYRELPRALAGRLRAPLGIAPEQVQPAMATSARNAKRPLEDFSADGQQKRDSASVELREAVARWAQKPYLELESLRRDQAD